MPQDFIGLDQNVFSTESSNPMVAEDSTDQVNQSIGFLVQPANQTAKFSMKDPYFGIRNQNEVYLKQVILREKNHLGRTIGKKSQTFLRLLIISDSYPLEITAEINGTTVTKVCFIDVIDQNNNAPKG